MVAGRGIHVLTPVPRTDRVQLPRAVSRALSQLRQLMELSLSHLKDQLWLERHRTQALWGLCTRLYVRLAAFCLGVHLALEHGLAPMALKHAVFGAYLRKVRISNMVAP